MNAAFQRGLVLFQQSRYDLADREFRRELAEAPDNPFAHAFLALCLVQRDMGEEALREADEAIRLDPDASFCHYTRGHVLFHNKRLKEAEASVGEAIRLDPSDADHYDLLARIHLSRRHWEPALEAAERGLSFAPEHTGCTNLRAMALVNLGRKDEAAQTLHSALANDPENSLTHANQGWALLHQGDHVRALHHFREALRLDPENEWARVGTIEALKARYLIYRLMLRFTLWMSRKSTAARWIFIIGIIFGQQALAGIAGRHPALAPYIVPVLVSVFAFLLLTWIASPLFNLLLCLNKFGRLALSHDQRIEASCIGAGFFAAVASLLAWALLPKTPSQVGEICAVYFGLLLLPLAVTFRQPPGRPRLWMAAATVIVASFGVPIFSYLLLGASSPFGDSQRALVSFGYFVEGAFLSTWIPVLLQSRGLE